MPAGLGYAMLTLATCVAAGLVSLNLAVLWHGRSRRAVARTPRRIH